MYFRGPLPVQAALTLTLRFLGAPGFFPKSGGGENG